MSLTKKQVYEFAKKYIGSQMALIDGGNIGGAESCDDAEKLVAEINRQGNQILGKRSLMLDPSEILKHVTQKQ